MKKKTILLVVLVTLIIFISSLAISELELKEVKFSFKPPQKAQTVYLAGSFNNWNPNATPMTDTDGDGIWEIVIPLPAGKHLYKFVVDGSEWYDDPNNPDKEDDGHNGYNSILYIGEIKEMAKIEAKPDDGQVIPYGLYHDNTIAYFNRYNPKKYFIKLRTFKNDILEAYLDLSGLLPSEKKMEYKYSDNLYSYYETKLITERRKLIYRFKLKDDDELFYYGKNGLEKDMKKSQPFIVKTKEIKIFNTPKWAKNAIWYQIMIERFRNGSKENDPPNIVPWTHNWFDPIGREKEEFYDHIWDRRYGGDLQGVIEEFDYIKDLGITAIYFNPVFKAYSLHKYDAVDYRHIDDTFGFKGDIEELKGETLDPKTWKFTKTDKLFLDFIKMCHENGIKVIIDGVFNHTGNRHWAFLDVMKNKEKSPYANWYKILSFEPFKYVGWAGFGGLPELNQDKNGLVPEVKQHIFNITKRWMDPNGDGDPSDGVDGWRLDVPDLIADPFWYDWRKLVKGINPESYIVAELWGHPAAHLKGDKWDAAMNYELLRRIYKFLIDTEEPYTPSQFDTSLKEYLYSLPLQVIQVQQNLLSSHDIDRIASAVINPDRGVDAKNRVQDNGPDFDNSKPPEWAYQRTKLITIFQMTFLGAPMIWYGDEVGMWGADDPTCRKPMLWKDLEPYEVPKENFVNEALLNHYKKVAAIRNTYPALRIGCFEGIYMNDEMNVYAFKRWDKKNDIIVVLNNNRENSEVTIPVDYKSGTEFIDVLNAKDYKIIDKVVNGTSYTRRTIEITDPSEAIITVREGKIKLDLKGSFGAILVKQ